MATLRHDARYACRQLRKGPVSTALALSTIAVGTALATLLLSVADLVLFRPLPYRDADRLAYIQLTVPEARGTTLYGRVVPRPLFERWAQDARGLSALAAHSSASAIFETAGGVQRVEAIAVTANVFPMLGVMPAIGRSFLPVEDMRGAAPVVVVSDAFWQRHLGGDRTVIGRHLRLEGVEYQVIGVMPPDFHVPFSTAGSEREATEVWVPFGAPTDPAYLEQVNVLGRLAPGADAAAVQRALDRITEGAPEALGAGAEAQATRERAAQVAPIRQAVLGQVATPVRLSLAALGCVIVLIVANVAGLQFARLTARRPELVLRAALGASRRDIAQLIFLESTALVMLGGLAGLAFAATTLPFAVRLLEQYVPVAGQVGLNLRVLSIICLTITSIAAVFGLLSAWYAARAGRAQRLAQGAGIVEGGRGRLALGNALVISEIALTVLLVGCTGLLAKSLRALTESPRGFDTHGVLTASVSLRGPRYATPAQQLEFTRQAVTQLQQFPGVTHVAAAHGVPMLATYSSMFDIVQPNGVVHTHKGSLWEVTSDYFGALGLRVVQGRLPVPADGAGAYVVDEAAVAAYFGGKSPIGLRIRLPKDRGTGQVVGVVGTLHEFSVDTKDNSHVRATRPHIIAPYGTGGGRFFNLVVRAQNTSAGQAGDIAQAIRALDPNVLLDDVQWMDARIGTRYARERILTALSLAFAMLGLLIAAGGLYALMAQRAAQRVREFGIRLALGASAQSILRLTLYRGIGLATAGVAVGLLGMLATGTLLRTMLFEVSTLDPMVYAVSGAVLLIVATAASYGPARRSTRIDPMSSLRTG